MSVIAVVGHRGRMGTMLSGHWREAGHTVRGADREVGSPSEKDGCAIAPERLMAVVSGADIVVLCVPAPAVQGVLAQLPLRADQLLMDITSVKILPMRSMEEYHQGPVVGTHPLFGPVSRPEARAVALIPGSRAEPCHLEQVAALFTCFGCRTFQTTAEEHDRGVAFVQCLNFISSAVYFASARTEEVFPFVTPSFRRRLENARKLLTEDASMFEDFTSVNPMANEALRTFRHFLDLAENGGLHEVVRRAGEWF